MGKRVLHVTWNMGIGGQERAVYQLIREQRRTGIEADLLLPGPWGPYADKVSETGATIHHLRMKGAHDLWNARRARGIYDTYDLIHFHSVEPLLVRYAARRHGIRAFYTHRAGRFRYPMKKRIRYWIAGRYIRNDFHGVSGNTRQAADAAAELFWMDRDKIAVTYNGIDFSLLEPRREREAVLRELGESDDGSVRIGTSGNLRDWKRIDLLLEAVALLEADNVRCYVIGDGPDRARLETIAKKSGMNSNIVFTGKTGHIGDFLQILDIFVLPSGPEESFGNSAIEAMGIGLPTIIFKDGGGLTEHVSDLETGFIVESRSELQALLRKLLQDPVLRRETGKRAMIDVRERYSVTRMIDGYRHWYEGHV